MYIVIMPHDYTYAEIEVFNTIDEAKQFCVDMKENGEDTQYWLLVER